MSNADHIGAGPLRKTMHIAVAATAALVFAVVFVVSLNVPLNLSLFKDDIAAMAQETLGVGVAIDGDLHLIPGRWPAVEIRGLRLWRPSGESFPKLLRLAYFKIGVAMMPLLKRELRIKEVVARGLFIELKGSDGSRAGSGNQAEKQTRQDRDLEAPAKKPPFRMIAVNRIDLHDAAVAIGRKEPFHTVVFSEISGSATDKNGLKLSVKGTYSNIPLELAIDGGSLTALLARSASWPLGLSARGAGAELIAGGQIHPMERGAAFDVRLSGRVDPQMEALLGGTVAAFENYRIAFQIGLDDSLVRVSDLDGSFDNTQITGDGQWDGIGKRLTGVVDAAVLDLGPVIRSVYPDDGPEPQPDTWIDADSEKPFSLPEMDVKLNIRRVLTEKLSYDDCSLKATIRCDRTSASRFQFALGKSSFNGEASLDLVRQPPALGLRFSANRLDLGQLLEEFGVADGINARAGSLDVIVTTRGRRLAELIIQREISVRVQQGQWVLTDTNTGAAVAIGIDSAEFSEKPGDPFRLDVGGHIQDTPLTVRWEIQKKRPNDAPGDGYPYQLETEAAGTRLALTGRLVFPLRKRGLEHRVSVSGNRLDSLEPLLTVSLPPWGPYKMTGVIRVRPEGYSLSDAAVSIGDSRFLGQLNIGKAAARPKVTTNLEARTIQLKGFGRKASAPGQGRPAATGRQPGRSADNEKKRRLRQLLDPSSASPLDADVSISVDEVLAGTNRLGSGKLRMTRKANRISVSPLELSIPGGDVNGTLDLSRIDGGVQGTLKVDIHQLDYGPLLRLKDPNTENSGRVSLVIDLKSTADSMDALMAQADGRVAVSIQPENIRAGVLDFWATNLLTAILPVLNPKNESKINCIVADLAMDGGIMKEKSIVIDTSKIRVRGNAQIDFKQQTIQLKLIPKPKRPQFISLATPIEVRGKFSDFGVRLAPGDLIGTVIRILTAYIVVPVQWIILNKLPEHGSDVCRDAISNHFQ